MVYYLPQNRNGIIHKNIVRTPNGNPRLFNCRVGSLVFLGNFGPEISETLLAKHFDGPKMFIAAEEENIGVLSEYIGTCVSEQPVTLLDINNTLPKELYKKDIEGKYDYAFRDTFMGFHCGNTCTSLLCKPEMKYQKIMARALPKEVTNGTLEGDIKPGEILCLLICACSIKQRMFCMIYSIDFVKIKVQVKYLRKDI